ncbi:MAG: PilZ domain-containing protein [Gammaproteobacteria bacterium]|nr:PilZ domain-containing protein [Gammaproteobacteria bacterium]
MEHRHSDRISKKLYAKIYFSDNTSSDVLTRDVSKQGLFIELRNLKLVNNRILKVVLWDSGGIYSWYTRAMVIHARRDGAGLLLEKDLPLSFRQEMVGNDHLRAQA